MPQCSKCHYLVDNHCEAHSIAKEILKRPLPPPPTGACMIPIVESYLKRITKGVRVLEVGCGSWTLIKDHCTKVGAHYEGIDTQAEYYGVKSVATRIENLNGLSFEDESFDLVIGNQTMEHWGEHGCTLELGLYQCFRVCKSGGKVLLNIPFHFHGTKEFLLGDVEKLQKIFSKFSSEAEFERWGHPSAPIPAFYPHTGFWTLKNKPAHVMDIVAVKNRPLPKLSTLRSRGHRGRMAQIVNYPISFNLYRVGMKLGLTPARST